MAWVIRTLDSSQAIYARHEAMIDLLYGDFDWEQFFDDEETDVVLGVDNFSNDGLALRIGDDNELSKWCANHQIASRTMREIMDAPNGGSELKQNAQAASEPANTSLRNRQTSREAS